MYIIQSDLLDLISNQQLIQLTDDLQTGTVDSSKIDLAISDAEAEVNGYVAARYRVPIFPVLDLVKKLSKAIAVKNLYARRQRVPDAVRKEYDDAVSILKDISKGLVTLGVDPQPAESVKATGGEIFGPDRVFDRDKLGSF